jgi:CheY-like chemotaxis protein
MARILLVEDEPLVRELADEDLTLAGHTDVAARDGEEALVILQGDAWFEVLFTDINMPGSVDGWQLAEEARRMIPSIKVVYASGLSDGGRQCGADERRLQKPYRIEDVMEMLAELDVRV